MNQGYTLLLSVLIASLVLTLGLSIFNITIKELLLSSSARESQFAFYAADSGIECALFWDQRGDAFSTSTVSTINCNEQSITDMGGDGYGVAQTFTLTFSPEPYCATVSVTKLNNPLRTRIESKGYNTCDTNDPRRVERALRVSY